MASGVFCVEMEFRGGVNYLKGFPSATILPKAMLPGFIRTVVIAIHVAALDKSGPFLYPPPEIAQALARISGRARPEPTLSLTERQVSFLA
jgi:hypothetical protein